MHATWRLYVLHALTGEAWRVPATRYERISTRRRDARSRGPEVSMGGADAAQLRRLDDTSG